MCSQKMNVLILKDIFQTPEEDVHKLIHYTTAESERKIVGGKTISLLLRRADCLLDENEGLLILEPFYYACGELYERGIIDSEFYELLKSISKNDIREVISNTYVVCFSKNGNSKRLKKRYSPKDGWILYILYDNLFELSRIISSNSGNADLLYVCYSFEYVVSISASNIKDAFKFYKNKLIGKANEEKQTLKNDVKKQIIYWLQNNCLAYKANFYDYEEEVRLIYTAEKNFSVIENQIYGIRLETITLCEVPYIKMTLDKKYLWEKTQELDSCFDTKINKAIVSRKEIQEVLKNK